MIPMSWWHTCTIRNLPTLPRSRNSLYVEWTEHRASSNWNVKYFNTLRPRQNRRHFPDDIFKCIFLNKNEWISIKNSLKFVPNGQINNIPLLFPIMAWRRSGDKPLSEAIMVNLLTHISVTRPQWVNNKWYDRLFQVCRGTVPQTSTLKWDENI